MYNRAVAVKIYSIEAGDFWLDGGTMFGVVPRVLWQRQYRPDDQNRIRQGLRTLLIIDGDRNILVDAGIGNWHEEKFLKNYDLHNSDFDFDSALGAYNLSTDDITDVILTHLHFDHAGGAVSRRNSEMVPTFRRARTWLQKEQLAWAEKPSAKDRASFMDTYLKPLRRWAGLELLEGKHRITDKVSVMPVYGHTPAMQTVMVETETGKHFFATDLVPLASHLHIPYLMAYDNNPVITVQEKQTILAEACREQWTVYFCHDPHTEKGQVISEDGKFGLKPL